MESKPPKSAEPVKIHIDKIGDEGLNVDEKLTPAWLVEALGADSMFHPVSDGHLLVHLNRVEDLVTLGGTSVIN